IGNCAIADQRFFEIPVSQMALRGAAQITETLQAEGLQLWLALWQRTQLCQRGCKLLVFDEQLDRALLQALRATNPVRNIQDFVQWRQHSEEYRRVVPIKQGRLQFLSPGFGLGADLHQEPRFDVALVPGKDIGQLPQNLETILSGRAMNAPDRVHDR